MPEYKLNAAEERGVVAVLVFDNMAAAATHSGVTSDTIRHWLTRPDIQTVIAAVLLAKLDDDYAAFCDALPQESANFELWQQAQGMNAKLQVPQ